MKEIISKSSKVPYVYHLETLNDVFIKNADPFTRRTL